MATLLTHGGRHPERFHGFVNPPLVRASTVLFESVAAMEGRTGHLYPYGLTNTPTIEALTEILTALEGAAGTVLVPSGLAAVTVAILSAAKPGGTILVPDNVYGPTRRFCDESLPDLGVAARYYDPLAPELGALDERTIIFIEAPGSLTFEMPDIAALVAAAEAAGAVTMMDNTWATPLFYRPLEYGVDLSISAGTKYFAGHSDLLIGSVSANARSFAALKRIHRNLGVQAGTEEIWLTLRGLRTMHVRLARHQENALAAARWLAGRAEVARVLSPALPGDPGHALWRRDFAGASGLFGFVLDAGEDEAKRFLDALRLFGLGYSWGGFESLAVLGELRHTRTVRPWREGPVIRLHIGLEDLEDILADLDQAFAAMRG
ncbi:cystathionine beta-lyase [Rhizobiales bacterium L72]|uniref:Cystathionine beta-lyase n=2 Tax=Propylenella binzhouense TaxID=2555902 RepID=A0A964T7S6_9HYPH|nr:cystathionine beta-lyase [Propylenella binzhouense]